MHRICSAAALAAALAACSPSSPAASKRSPPTYSLPQTQAGLLRAFDWYPLEATDAQGRRVGALRGARHRGLHVRFDDNDVYRLKGVCNTASGSYRLEGSRMLRDDKYGAVQTVAGCLRGLAMEIAFFRLATVNTQFAVVADGGIHTLLITHDDGARIRLVGVPTAQTRYGSPGTKLELQIDDERRCPPPSTRRERCLHVRQVRSEGANEVALGDWYWLREPIEGYRHQSCFRATLQVLRFDLAAGESGAATVAYVMQHRSRSARIQPETPACASISPSD